MKAGMDELSATALNANIKKLRNLQYDLQTVADKHPNVDPEETVRIAIADLGKIIKALAYIHEVA